VTWDLPRPAPADGVDQYMRLARFRRAHPPPLVVIGDGGFGTWTARIIEENGETVINRDLLEDLLDKLDTLFPPSPP
jgi:hypothetical protein